MIFLNSASSAAALVFDLPLCTHTDTEGKPSGQSPEYILKSSKKTQYLMNTLYLFPRTFLLFPSLTKDIVVGHWDALAFLHSCSLFSPFFGTCFLLCDLLMGRYENSHLCTNSSILYNQRCWSSYFYHLINFYLTGTS